MHFLWLTLADRYRTISISDPGRLKLTPPELRSVPREDINLLMHFQGVLWGTGVHKDPPMGHHGHSHNTSQAQSQDRKGDDARVNMPDDGITAAVSQCSPPKVNMGTY